MVGAHGRQIDHITQMRFKALARPRASTQRGEMCGLLWSMTVMSSISAKAPTRQGQVGGVGSVGEHRLTEKHAAQAHAIQASDQLTVYPGFERVDLALGMPVRIDRAHVGTI